MILPMHDAPKSESHLAMIHSLALRARIWGSFSNANDKLTKQAVLTLRVVRNEQSQ